MVLSVLVLGFLLVCAALTLVLRRAPWAWALIGASAVWLPANQPVEGSVLLTLAPTHGVTTSDLLGLAGFAIGLAVLLGREWAGHGFGARRLARLTAGAGSVFALGALAAYLNG